MARVDSSTVENLPKPAELEFFCRLHDCLEAGRTIDQLASDLRIHKSVLYKRLDQLEAKVRPPDATWHLIDRGSGKASSVTPEGRNFYRDALRILEFYSRQISKFTGHREDLVIGSTNAITTYYLPLIFSKSRYLAEHPSVDVRVEEGEWYDLLKHLRQGTINFGIGPAVPVGHGYTHQHLMKLKRILAYRLDHPRFSEFRSERDVFDLEWLATETVLLLPEGSQPDYQSVAEKLPLPRPGVGRRIMLPTYAEMRIWVKHGLGVAIIHDRHLVPEESRLGRIDLSGQLGETDVELYLPSNGKAGLSTAAAELVTYIERFEAAFAADERQQNAPE